MSQSKDKFQINTEIQTIYDKLDYTEYDLMRFHNQSHDEVNADLTLYLQALPDDLPKDYFDKEEWFEEYTEAKADQMEEFTKLQVKAMYYQPSLFTDDIDSIIKNPDNNLMDIRPNRYSIAMILKENNLVDAEIIVSDLISNRSLIQNDSSSEDYKAGTIGELEDVVKAEVTNAIGLEEDLELLKDDREKINS